MNHTKDPTVARADREILALELKAAEGDLLARIDLLRRALSGLAANATNCRACEMSARVARLAIERDDRLVLGEC